MLASPSATPPQSFPTSKTLASPTSTPLPTSKAKPGSTHGYDVIDHSSLNPEIGTQAEYDAFVASAPRALSTFSTWSTTSASRPTTTF